MNSSVLIVAYYYPPSGASAAPRPFRFASNLAETGFVPSVITVGEVETVEGNLIRVPEKGKPGFSRWLAKSADFLESRILNYRLHLPWVLAVVRFLRRVPQRSFDIVHSVGPPYCVHLVAYWIKRTRGSVWIVDTQDPVNLPPDPPTGLRDWFRQHVTLPFLERFLVKHADVMVANTPQAGVLLQKRFPRWKDKIEVLPNGFDAESRLTAVAIPARDYVVLSHYGDLYSFRNPAKLLESLDRLVEAQQVSPDRLRVELVGEEDDHWVGCAPERVKELLGRPWVRHVASRVPRSEAREATATADYLLLLDTQGPVSQYFMPAKIYEYITVGRPILCFTERSSPAEQLLVIAGIPHVIVYYDDPPAVTDKKVVGFLHLPKDPARPSTRFEQDCAGRALTKHLAGIYRTVSGLAGNRSLRSKIETCERALRGVGTENRFQNSSRGSSSEMDAVRHEPQGPAERKHSGHER